MRDIALLGKARAGKDSVAKVLTEEFGYRRLAFADELKESALEINPWIVDPVSGDRFRLRDLVEAFGWERVKDEYPESREFLKDLGHAMRQIDEDIWISPVRCQSWDRPLGTSVVVTDCRYLNEAETLRVEGFLLVRVVRPNTGGDQHISETELDDYPADIVLKNSGSLEDLAASVRMLAKGERA